MSTESFTYQYIETPRMKSSPMKLDRLLKRRMRAFVRARRLAVSQLGE